MHYHPFLPRRWTSAAFLKWLKRIHAWTGLWGAACFLLLGASGFLLNHRTLMKIDTGEPVEVSSIDLPVLPDDISNADALGHWAQIRLRLPVKPQPLGVICDQPTEVGRTFLGNAVGVPVKWIRVFNVSDGRVTVSYLQGANFVSAKREVTGLLGILKNLHKGTGLPVAWILLMDTIAGALVAMSLTGFLLWSRLHGPRILAGALIAGTMAWAVIAATSSFG